MKRKIRVAAVQMQIEPLNIEKNVGKAEQLVEEIFINKPVDLIVFPEDCITGPIPYNLELAQDENSYSIKKFKALAVKYNTYIVCGSIIKKINEKFFNTSFL